jgi:hypothetical protein
MLGALCPISSPTPRRASYGQVRVTSPHCWLCGGIVDVSDLVFFTSHSIALRLWRSNLHRSQHIVGTTKKAWASHLMAGPSISSSLKWASRNLPFRVHMASGKCSPSRVAALGKPFPYAGLSFPIWNRSLESLPCLWNMVNTQ